MQGSLRKRFALLLAAAGLGLCGYAALQWRELPRFSEEDLKASTELNVQLDLARQGIQTPPPADELNRLRQQVRAEVEQELAAGRQRVLAWLMGGLAMLGAAGIQFAIARFAGQT
jgi:hypothetical protein